jgi:hypothetical protein
MEWTLEYWGPTLFLLGMITLLFVGYAVGGYTGYLKPSTRKDREYSHSSRSTGSSMWDDYDKRQAQEERESKEREKECWERNKSDYSIEPKQSWEESIVEKTGIVELHEMSAGCSTWCNTGREGNEEIAFNQAERLAKSRPGSRYKITVDGKNAGYVG